MVKLCLIQEFANKLNGECTDVCLLPHHVKIASLSIIKFRGYIIGEMVATRNCRSEMGLRASQVAALREQGEICGTAKWDGWVLGIKTVMTESKWSFKE